MRCELHGPPFCNGPTFIDDRHESLLISLASADDGAHGEPFGGVLASTSFTDVTVPENLSDTRGAKHGTNPRLSFHFISVGL